MNTQDEIKALKQRIAELEEQAKREQEFPQYGDTYWCINAFGRLSKETWDGYDIEKDMLAIGNGFRTEQEAEFALEKLKVEAELRKFSDSWDLEKTQYTFSFNWDVVDFEIECPDYNQYPDSYYFDSVDSLEQAIESIGADRIKKYIFEV